MEFKEIVEELLKGNIPAELEVKTTYLLNVEYNSRYQAPVTATLLTAARRQHFNNDSTPWLEWARQNFKFSGGHIHHMRAIGDMLLDMLASDPAVYKRLFGVGYDKLEALTQLDRETVPRFLAAHKVEEMDREDVRREVNRLLGKLKDDENTPKEEKHQPELPGFEDAMRSVMSWASEGREATDKLRGIITSKDSALLALKAGYRFVTAGLEKLAQEKDSAELLNHADHLESTARKIRESCARKEEVLKGA
jgi:hypothetical protein